MLREQRSQHFGEAVSQSPFRSITLLNFGEEALFFMPLVETVPRRFLGGQSALIILEEEAPNSKRQTR